MKILLSSHDRTWSESFDQIKLSIVSALGNEVLQVEHVGSTAVPDLLSKPVIDVVLVVKDSSREIGYVSNLQRAGFRLHTREPDWHEHRLFKLETPRANLHVFSRDCPEVHRMITFRDLLRTNPRARREYETRRRELAEKEWDRVQTYADAKAAVIEALLAREHSQ